MSQNFDIDDPNPEITKNLCQIIGEEKMLVNELEGYEEYKQKVSYGLIPLCLVTNGPLPWLARQAVR